MKALHLKDILDVIGGYIYHGRRNQLIEHVTCSPKKLKNNTLYFHFVGKLDLREFSGKNAVIVITENPSCFSDTICVVKVGNVQDAYWKFVWYYRRLFKIPVVGVTGTCGKTTTTEMIKIILSSRYITQSTYDGRNAQSLNLPYLLGIDERTKAAVFELAVGAPGSFLTVAHISSPM